MNVCATCGKPYGPDSCTGELIIFDRLRIPFGQEYALAIDEHDRCHDCGVEAGGLHHANCDVEECPNCGGQRISCSCSERLGTDRAQDEEATK